MIYGVVGTLDRDTMMKFGLYNMKTGRFSRQASKKGNGKTMVIVYYGYREFSEQGRKVYSNFHTKFSIYRSAQEIFDDLGRILDLAGKFGAYGTITEIIKNFDLIFANYPLKLVEQTELYELRSLYHEYYGSLIILTEFQKYFNSLGTSTKTVKWIEGIMTQLRKLGIDLMWDSQRPISAGNRTREYTETYLVPQKFHVDDESPCDMDICERDHFIKVFCDVPFRETPLVELDCKIVGELYETEEVIGDLLCAPQEKDKDQKEEDKQKRRKRKEGPVDTKVTIDGPLNNPKVEEEVFSLKVSQDNLNDLVDTARMARESPLAKKELISKIQERVKEIYSEEVVNKDTNELYRIIGDLQDKPTIQQLAEDLKEYDLFEDPTQDEIERMILEASPNIPIFIKALLPVYHKEGKIHGLYLIYYNENGTVKIPEEPQGIFDNGGLS